MLAGRAAVISSIADSGSSDLDAAARKSETSSSTWLDVDNESVADRRSCSGLAVVSTGFTLSACVCVCVSRRH